MNIDEAIKIVQENLNLKTETATDSTYYFQLNNSSKKQQFFLNQKHCLELAQAFMVLAANSQKSDTQ